MRSDRGSVSRPLTPRPLAQAHAWLSQSSGPLALKRGGNQHSGRAREDAPERQLTRCLACGVDSVFGSHACYFCDCG